ncbi:hypothetical protein GCM10023085_64270 [Actinomadura viridis]
MTCAAPALAPAARALAARALVWSPHFLIIGHLALAAGQALAGGRQGPPRASTPHGSCRGRRTRRRPSSSEVEYQSTMVGHLGLGHDLEPSDGGGVGYEQVARVP